MIGIIGAMAVEVEKMDSLLEDIQTQTIGGITFTKGTFAGKEVVTAVCGIGKVFAAMCAQTMILEYHPTAIINIGVAGGLSVKLTVTDIAIAENVVQHDLDTVLLGQELGQITGMDEVKLSCDKGLVEQIRHCVEELAIPYYMGTIASGDQFIADSAKKEMIIKEFQAIACEMEGAAIGQVCTVNNIPFAVIRAISDSADGEAGMSFDEFTQRAAQNSSKVMTKLLSREGCL